MVMSIDAMARKFYGHNRIHRDGEVIPYELAMWDNMGKRMAIHGFKKIPENRAEEYLGNFMKSFESGGVNVHISESLGYVPYPNKAKLFKNGELVWEWKSPMFMVW